MRSANVRECSGLAARRESWSLSISADDGGTAHDEFLVPWRLAGAIDLCNLYGAWLRKERMPVHIA